MLNKDFCCFYSHGYIPDSFAGSMVTETSMISVAQRVICQAMALHEVVVLGTCHTDGTQLLVRYCSLYEYGEAFPALCRFHIHMNHQIHASIPILEAVVIHNAHREWKGNGSHMSFQNHRVCVEILLIEYHQDYDQKSFLLHLCL